MSRSNRGWRVAAVLMTVPVLVLGPAWSAWAAEGEPTITFSSTGTPPLVCGSRPNVSSLSVKSGTKIIIANLTAVSATVDVGKKKLLDLVPGMGALLKLKEGQHELRVVPACVLIDQAVAVVVNVLPDGQPPDDPHLPDDPHPSDDPDEPAEGPMTVAVATPGPTGSAGSALGPRSSASSTTIAEASAGWTGEADPDGFTGVVDDSLNGEVVDVRAIDLGGSRDPKDVRLLALIAAICVLGVTVAIIRAIVSQRTSTSASL